MMYQYYDSENITESRLAFRRATSEPQIYVRDDEMRMRVLYDMDGYVTSIDFPNPVN